MLADHYSSENNHNQEDDEEEDDILLFLEKKVKGMKPPEDKLQLREPADFNIVKVRD